MANAQETTDALNNVVRSATFTTVPYGRFPIAKYNDASCVAFLRSLRGLLGACVARDSDRIGCSLARVMGGLWHQRLPDFARTLVGAAKVLGATRVVQLVSQWVNGEPLRHHEVSVLYGVSIDKPVAVEGIRIVKLASASNELIGRLPPSLVEMHGYRDILGGVLLVADAEYGPILHAVDGASSDYKWAHGSTKRESPADDFCEALSLACNGGVGLSYRWREFGELQGFNPGSSYESRRDVGGPTVGLSQEQLEEALKVYRARYRDKRLDTAIRQWVRSKRARSLADRSIDLRIALETLYLHGREWSEYRFRLANYGAWHLGKDVKERKEIRTAFKKAYDVCSKAVHEGSVEAKEEPSLVEAQNLCRRAILERLADRKTPVWDDLILGA